MAPNAPQQWPDLGNIPDSTSAHAHELKGAATALQKAIRARGKGNNVASVPGARILPFCESIEAFLEKFSRETGVQAWETHLNKIAVTQQQQAKQIAHIAKALQTATVGNSTATAAADPLQGTKSGVCSWATVAAGPSAPPPAARTVRTWTSATGEIHREYLTPTSEREITIKLHDSTRGDDKDGKAVKSWLQGSIANHPKALIDHINRAIYQGATSPEASVDTPMADSILVAPKPYSGIEVDSAVFLKSGDIQVHTTFIAQAKALIEYADHNCRHQHPAWNPKCDYRKRERQRVQEALKNKTTYWPQALVHAPPATETPGTTTATPTTQGPPAPPALEGPPKNPLASSTTPAPTPVAAPMAAPATALTPITTLEPVTATATLEPTTAPATLEPTTASTALERPPRESPAQSLASLLQQAQDRATREQLARDIANSPLTAPLTPHQPPRPPKPPNPRKLCQHLPERSFNQFLSTTPQKPPPKRTSSCLTKRRKGKNESSTVPAPKKPRPFRQLEDDLDDELAGSAPSGTYTAPERKKKRKRKGALEAASSEPDMPSIGHATPYKQSTAREASKPAPLKRRTSSTRGRKQPREESDEEPISLITSDIPPRKKSKDVVMAPLFRDPKVLEYDIIAIQEPWIMGDFNMEGPEWAAEDLGDRGSARQGLPYFRDFLRTKSLQVVLPEGTITREEGDSASTIDLAICNSTAASKLLKCRRADEIHHDSDHWPISTTIQLRTIKAADTSPTKLWKNTPVDVFRARLVARLPKLQGRPSDQDVVDTFQKVVAALQDTIEDTVPIANPTIRHTPGFTGACKEKCRETNRLRKVWQHTRTPGAWEAYRKVRNQKATAVKKALTENWQEKVNRASAEGPKGLWGLVKMTKTRGQGAAQQNVTPTINNETTFDGKVAALSKAFFPAPPDTPKAPGPH
ncbi:uncharacterized protein PG998_005563 [Apiospora kogelbergensis]|uniref:uncharacterized protein n=1 Tax=Apiospora kogelbergensis TaxID=1337665 RepID=UPI00312E017D